MKTAGFSWQSEQNPQDPAYCGTIASRQITKSGPKVLQIPTSNK